MKKIIILTAEKTGTGHKSAANALEKRLVKFGYDVKQIDCFTLMGKFGNMLEESYIPVTTKNPKLFYAGFVLTQTSPNSLHRLMYVNLKKALKKEIAEYKPDLIITVHSMFTKSISHLLKKENLNIPFYVDVIDLVNPPKVWFDKNADMIFVPTEEVKKDYVKKGIEENKIIVSGFPIRDDIERRKTAKKITGKINILLVNPSVNLRKNIRYVQEVSKIDNTNINVICGRDEKLYRVLTKLQEKGHISKDVKIHSFVKNMNEFLDEAHILLAKAGPNMLLEGARSATAVVVTGHIQGQENHNYEYITKNGFGFKCENPREIYDKLTDFIESKELDKCLTNVLKADCNNGAEIIANYIKENI